MSSPLREERKNFAASRVGVGAMFGVRLALPGFGAPVESTRQIQDFFGTSRAVARQF